jgi:hypothetical protein
MSTQGVTVRIPSPMIGASPFNSPMATACAWAGLGMPPQAQFFGFLQLMSQLMPALAQFLNAQRAGYGGPGTPGPGSGSSLPPGAARVDVDAQGNVSAEGPDGPSVYRALQGLYGRLLERRGSDDPRTQGVLRAIQNWTGAK